MKRINKKIIVVEQESGEILEEFTDGSIIMSEPELQQKREYFKSKSLKDSQLKYQKKRADTLGNFIWCAYPISFNIFDLSLKPSNLTRLIYLATYLDYDNCLIEDVMPFKEKQPLTKKRISQILNLSSTEFSCFFDEVVNKRKIISCEQGKYYMNTKLFGKGELPKSKINAFAKRNVYITTMYRNSIREMYIGSKPRLHKQLSYIFKILPYVNRQYNIVAYNPLEDDLDKVSPMTLTDFCKTIGYSITNTTHLFSLLSDVLVDGNKESAILYSPVIKGSNKTKCIIVNPKIYYAGNKLLEVEILCDFTKNN